jgi:hypothetical protein
MFVPVTLPVTQIPPGRGSLRYLRVRLTPAPSSNLAAVNIGFPFSENPDRPILPADAMDDEQTNQ